MSRPAPAPLAVVLLGSALALGACVDGSDGTPAPSAGASGQPAATQASGSGEASAPPASIGPATEAPLIPVPSVTAVP